MKNAVCALLLLAGCAKENGAVQAPSSATPRAQLPTPQAPAAHAAASNKHDVYVIVDRAGTRLSDDATVLVPSPKEPGRGADAAHKRHGQNDLYLVPLASALTRAKAAARLGTRLRVLVGKDVGYRVLIEALYTAGQHEVGEFELCEETCGARSLVFRPPRLGDLRGPPEHETLNLSVILVADGIAVKTSFGNVAPGCESGVGPGIAIPKRDGAYDLAALGACAQRLEAQAPAFASEEDVVLTAAASVPFSQVMDVALTLQGPTKSLFSRVTFGVAK